MTVHEVFPGCLQWPTANARYGDYAGGRMSEEALDTETASLG